MDSLESQNDDLIEGLSQKVRILKNVSTSLYIQPPFKGGTDRR